MSFLEELIKKLRYKQGPALVLNPPEGYILGIETDKGASEHFDFIQLFVNNSEDVRKWLPDALPLLNEDALFWITYPKQSSKVKTDINRDSLFKLVQELSHFRAVSNVSVDEKWSALRFRHKDKVKSKK
ncbi:hypothetical protein M3204_11185 [Mesobacillus subterraneus]|uniref:hypothetical protein n=1 Tax=Mesobacillus subterraneus TaxID=285983 RepID=UPI002041FF53|nr:hypothetical protein [Mesobacillus subterraneus]MCM3664972.1 hypothetical protein [Mesobacillus subterraneus]MCM3682059.1 hypothetical protein [Mesobacillus subterraneus]